MTTTEMDNELLKRGFRLNKKDTELIATNLSILRVDKEDFIDALKESLMQTVWYSKTAGHEKGYYVMTKAGVLVAYYEKL